MMEPRHTSSVVLGYLPPVAQPDPDGVPANLSEAVEARAVVEGALARLAADRRTEADLARLADALEAMSAAGPDRDAFVEGDLVFHLALSAAAHSRLLSRTIGSLPDPVRETVVLVGAAAHRRGRACHLVELHARVVDAVHRRDPDVAAAIMEETMTTLLDESPSDVSPVASHRSAHGFDAPSHGDAFPVECHETPHQPVAGEPAPASKGERS